MSIDILGFGNLEDTYEVNLDAYGATVLQQAVLQLSSKVETRVQTVLAKSRWPDCPPNFQWPVCMNRHKAVFVVEKPDGKFYRWLCNYCTCDYEFHNFSNNYLRPGYSIMRIDSNKDYNQ